MGKQNGIGKRKFRAKIKMELQLPKGQGQTTVFLNGKAKWNGKGKIQSNN